MSEVSTIGDNIENKQENETHAEDSSQQTWLKREKQLSNRIAEYESSLVQEKYRIAALQKELQAHIDEKNDLKKQNVKLEKELARKQGKNQKTNDTNDVVTQASGVIFEKTKQCQNQELQIQALTEQVKSLKEIVSITKDMLEIRNMEVKQLQDKLDVMDLKFAAEKDRHALMHAKLDRMIKINADLKTEYETQLALFLELQKNYKLQQELSNKSD